MKRAERRRAEREARKAQKNARPGLARPKHQSIDLVNPVSSHFPSFIVANAAQCDRVVQEGSAEGRSLVLCGAGPSLKEHVDECDAADQVWGCNSAATWLYDQGRPVTHAFTVDQTPAMLEEWYAAPPIDYLLASTVHPHLTEYLSAKERSLTFFHNYVGIKKPPVAYVVCEECGHVGDYRAEACEQCASASLDRNAMSYEDWLYCSLFPPTGRCGSGLNSVNRALDLALFMGFEEITVLGADCAIHSSDPMPRNLQTGTKAHRRWLEENTVMHADGGHALASGSTSVTLDGWIDGRYWLTKPDMIISAVWLVKFAQQHEGRVRFVGDTLPNALRDKDDAFLQRCAAMVDGEGNEMPIA